MKETPTSNHWAFIESVGIYTLAHRLCQLIAERRHETFTIGRLSRAAPEKYPEDFPVFYERLQLPEARFRVIAWSEALGKKYRWHAFGRRWDLLPPRPRTP